MSMKGMKQIGARLTNGMKEKPSVDAAAIRELANLLERLAILFPAQTVTAADLPDRYRGMGAVGWSGSGVRVQAL